MTALEEIKAAERELIDHVTQVLATRKLRPGKWSQMIVQLGAADRARAFSLANRVAILTRHQSRANIVAGAVHAAVETLLPQ